MKLLSRSALLSAKLPIRDVPVPEVEQGAVVRVQQMSVNTRATYLERIRTHRQEVLAYEDDQLLPVAERANLPKPADVDYAILCIIHSLVDEDGNAMFVEADAPLFNTWSNIAVTRIYEAAIEINDYDRSTNDLIEAEKKG